MKLRNEVSTNQRIIQNNRSIVHEEPRHITAIQRPQLLTHGIFNENKKRRIDEIFIYMQLHNLLIRIAVRATTKQPASLVTTNTDDEAAVKHYVCQSYLWGCWRDILIALVRSTLK
jgi:hypothetical protein